MITEIFEEIDHVAALANGAIISQAFRAASIHCPDCKYPENAGTFRWRIMDYNDAVKRFFRMKRAYDNAHYSFSWLAAKDLTLIECCERENKAERKVLKGIWPCEECIIRYNPTGRRAHNPSNQPIMKGLI